MPKLWTPGVTLTLRIVSSRYRPRSPIYVLDVPVNLALICKAVSDMLQELATTELT